MKTLLAVVVLAGIPAIAHRLDEYLQGTIITVEKDRVQAEITLTPGVAVFPILLADIDSDADGVISENEQRAYAARVLRDLSLTIDGRPLALRLLSSRFPNLQEMKDGLAGIHIEFIANSPPGGRKRRLIFENHHQSRIAAYQVNCLVPSDPEIQIIGQNRDYLQSRYQLEYEQAGARSDSLFSLWWQGDLLWLGGAALLLFARFVWLWRKRTGAPAT